MLGLRLTEQEVCNYWSVIFSPKGIASLTKQDMNGFLSYEQNRRWKELSKENVTRDMQKLRAALAHLLDDSLPLTLRLDNLDPASGSLAIPYLGKAKLGAVLLVTHPRQYGVWNDYSERALRAMGLFPNFEPGWHLGQQYEAVNKVFLSLSSDNQVTMWWLDIILEKIALMIL